jgi:hypothetical protein
MDSLIEERMSEIACRRGANRQFADRVFREMERPLAARGN